MALCHGLSHLTEAPLNIPFPRTQTQTVDPSHQGKVNKAKHRKARKDTGPGLASGSQPAGKGSQRCQHLFKLLTRRPAVPGAPTKLNKGPQQLDSWRLSGKSNQKPEHPANSDGRYCVIKTFHGETEAGQTFLLDRNLFEKPIILTSFPMASSERHPCPTGQACRQLPYSSQERYF